jgi:putative membrane protein
MRWSLPFAAAAVMVVGADAHDGAPVSNVVRADASPAAAAAQKKDPDEEAREFVNLMLTAGLKEVEVSRIAERSASSPAVKEFAAMMVRDHEKGNDDLRALGGKMKVAFDPQKEDARAALAKVANLNGAAFDRAYMDLMVGDHETVVRSVEEKGEKSSNALVQQWAAKTLPTLRNHLEHARKVRQGLES